MPNANGKHLYLPGTFDIRHHLAKVSGQIVTGIGTQGARVDRCTIRYHHEYASLLRPFEQPFMGPQQRLAVDVLFQDVPIKHQAKLSPGIPIRRIRRLVNDMAQIIKSARIIRLAIGFPKLGRTATVKVYGGKPEYLYINATTFQGARQNVRHCRSNHDGAA